MLTLDGGGSMSSAQSATPDEPHCLAIHVRLNGKPIDGPQIIALKTRESESTAFLKEGCFEVRASLLKEKTADVSFTLPGDKIYMSSISTTFFTEPRDVDLADKHFDRGVPLPKHRRTKEMCVVTFHGGDPEIVWAMAPCRAPLPKRTGHD
jgi:hypothetical protein